MGDRDVPSGFMSPRGSLEIVQTLRRVYGRLQFHDLRHSAVSLLPDLGVPPHIAREIVGHADLGVTMTIDAHASPTRNGAALRKLDERLR